MGDLSSAKEEKQTPRWNPFLKIYLYSIIAYNGQLFLAKN